MHSALCSSALIAAGTPEIEGASGYDPSGWLREGAHHVVRAIAFGALTPSQREDAQRAALRHAATLGIALPLKAIDSSCSCT